VKMSYDFPALHADDVMKVDVTKVNTHLLSYMCDTRFYI
jgi:hypothetical protein